jgi:hypothetical protein
VDLAEGFPEECQKYTGYNPIVSKLKEAQTPSLQKVDDGADSAGLIRQVTGPEHGRLSELTDPVFPFDGHAEQNAFEGNYDDDASHPSFPYALHQVYNLNPSVHNSNALRATTQTPHLTQTQS